MITKTSELKCGDLIFWWSGEFQAYLQMLFTRRGKRYYDPNKRDGKVSHNSPVFSVKGETAKELNISDVVKLSDFTLDAKAIKFVYRPDVPEEILIKTINRYYMANAGKHYPILQWLTYPSRAIFEVMYKYKFLYYPLGWIWHWSHKFKDARRWGTAFPKGDVCDEGTLWVIYVDDICLEMSRRGDKRFDALSRRLREWSQHKFHATDALVVVGDFPDIFELIFSKTKE